MAFGRVLLAGILRLAASHHAPQYRSFAEEFQLLKFALEFLKALLVAFVPANWPDCGLDPREVWRARALENGSGLAACNRTGAGGALDCTQARSYALAPGGRVLLDFSSEFSAIAHVEYPLMNGRFCPIWREQVLARRRPQSYKALAGAAGDLPQLCDGLPAPGRVVVECAVSEEALSAGGDGSVPRIVIAPQIGAARRTALLAGKATAVITTVSNGSLAIFTGDGCRGLAGGARVVIADFGPARIALIEAADMVHPEASAALAKQGCDLVVTSIDAPLAGDARLLLGIKSTDRIVVAALGNHGGMISVPPLGHERWRELSTSETGACSVEIDTAAIRRRTFVESLDLEALLR